MKRSLRRKPQQALPVSGCSDATWTERYDGITVLAVSHGGHRVECFIEKAALASWIERTS